MKPLIWVLTFLIPPMPMAKFAAAPSQLSDAG
jgi:hypothetical protein